MVMAWVLGLLLVLGMSLNHASAANVLVDPGFEEGGAAWSMNTWAGTSQLDTTTAHTGVNSWKFNADQTGDAWNGGRQLDIPGDSSKFYQYSAWVNVPGASSANKLGWAFRHNIGAGGVDLGYTQISAPGWIQLKGPIIQLPPDQFQFGYVGFHSMGIQLPYYVDDLAVEEMEAWTLTGRVVDAGGNGVDDASVIAASPAWTSGAATTASGGYYSITVPGTAATYTLSASAVAVKGSVTQPVSANPTAAANIVLAPDPDYDPDLIFSVRSSAISPGSAWPTAFPAGDSLVRMGNPGVHSYGGVQWEQNAYATGDGWRFTTAHGVSIPCNGVSVVAAVKPKRFDNSWWSSIVNCFYNSFMLNVRNTDGRVQVVINDNWYDGPTLNDGQTAIVSAVVQPDATIAVYVNGVESRLTAPVGDYTEIIAGGTGGFTYAQDINIGRNDPDGWSTFNGSIGDVYLYKVALDPAKRTALENSLIAKFITNATLSYSLTASADSNGSISPSGTTAVVQGYDQTYAITANSGYVVNSVLVDGVSVGAVTSYTFANVSANHTIAATFVAMPPQTITASSGPNGTLNPIGEVSVPAGASQTFAIIPETGYAVADVLVDGVSQGEIYSYTFSFVIAPHTISATFRALDMPVPRTDQIIFSVVANALPGDGSTTGPWPTYVPGGKALTMFGTPTSVVGVGGSIGTSIWESNVRETADGYRYPGGTGAGGEYLAPIPCNGASIVVVAAPYATGPADAWNSIVDVFYDRLTLGIRNDTGAVFARVNGTGATSTTLIPSLEPTILSMVVQPDGTYNVWANAGLIMTGAGSALTSLAPGADGYRHYINLGRNDPDGWTAFSGNIGDVFLYKTALTDAEREGLQQTLAAKYGIVLPVYTTISGKVTLTDGTTPVAGATVTATGVPGILTATTAPDGTYVMTVEGNLTYVMDASKASHAAATPINVAVGDTPVTDKNFTLRLITAVAGTVRTATGAPIPNAVVQVGDAGPAAVSDASGKYTVLSVVPGPGATFYADALGYADHTETIDTSAAADGVVTKDVVLAPKTEADYTYSRNGGFETGTLSFWTPDNNATVETGVTAQETASGNYAGYWEAKTGIDYYQGYLRQFITVVPGSTYNIYWKLKTPNTGNEGQSGFDFLGVNADGNLESVEWWGYDGLGNNWMYTPLPGVWEQTLNYRTWDNGTKLTAVRVTAPAGAVAIQIIAGLGTRVPGHVLYVDDVVVDRVGPAAPPLSPVITLPNGVPTFTFETMADHSYRMAYMNSLSDNAWIPLGAWMPADGTPMTLIDDSTPSLPATRFYRLEIQ